MIISGVRQHNLNGLSFQNYNDQSSFVKKKKLQLWQKATIDKKEKEKNKIEMTGNSKKKSMEHYFFLCSGSYSP